jgi:protein-S-isoprenylcysteine O-methyltransferase Ste14
VRTFREWIVAAEPLPCGRVTGIPQDSLVRRALVVGAVLVYWGGVFIHSRRVRRHIGRAPNVRPRGLKETLLWVGWFVGVAGWLMIPWVACLENGPPWLRIIPVLRQPWLLGLGALALAAGYAGTLRCYVAMGDAWRMGVDRQEKTQLIVHGPYRFVRHPIYLFQLVMALGMLLAIPAAVSLLVFITQLVCILIKAADEEAYLLRTHGAPYRDYCSRTGWLLPKTGGGREVGRRS